MRDAPRELPLAEAREIETLCRCFDRELRKGNSPRLEEFLGRCRNATREQLLPELLATEIDFRIETRSLRLETYHERFPEYREWIDHLLCEAEDVSEEAPLPERLGRYEIQRELGRGAMGQVVLAWDTRLERQVALKVPRFIQHAGARTVERFYREARLMARLRHQNLCPVYDVEEADGVHFMTMAYLPGGTLSSRLTSAEPWSVADAVSLVRRISRGLAVAHEAGLIHRDLKPGNILFDVNDEPVLTDFGLARGLTERSDMTLPGVVVGTPQYMAPEQIETPWNVGPAADVYALGVLLYRMLAGQLPHDASSPALLMSRIVANDPPPLTRFRSDVDERLVAICRQAMARDAEARFPTAAELRDALDAYSPAPPRLRTERASPGLAMPNRWGRFRTTLAAGLAVAGIVVTLAGWILQSRIFSGTGNSGRTGVVAGTGAIGTREAIGNQETIGNQEALGYQEALGNREVRGGPGVTRVAVTGSALANPASERRSEGTSPRRAEESLGLLRGGTAKPRQAKALVGKIGSRVGGGPELVDFYYFGEALASLGDLDGDGVGDIAVGAWRDTRGGDGCGAVHILFMNEGGTARDVVSISTLTPGGPQLSTYDRFGASVSGPGDVDGDGVPDLLVGASGGRNQYHAVGAVYLLTLRRDGSIKRTQRIGEGDPSAPSLAYHDMFGCSLTSLGDLNGDGVTDIAVGSEGDDTTAGDSGAVYVLLMRSDGMIRSWTKLADGQAGLKLRGGDRFGHSLALLGDLDRDGTIEIAVGAFEDDGEGRDRGAVHVISLDGQGRAVRHRRIAPGDCPGLVLADGDRFGSSVAQVGDVNGDGTADLAVGAPGDSASGVNRGAVHVLLLAADGTATPALKIGHESGGGPMLGDDNHFGSSIIRLPEQRGAAGIPILVGASGDDTGGTDRGALYRLFVQPGSLLSPRTAP